ncbi:MAG: hypothetical protein QM699_08820 [Amaricoccus sp.]|uniref:hypothetical protein n=1 Tax=Amaricoccus sp. TaxID=1872485 RepID=UPI0039E28B3E
MRTSLSLVRLAALPGPALALALSIAAPAVAQPAVDPDWPCVQRKVPELSIGQMWSGPLPSEGAAPDASVADLAGRIAPRRIDDDAVKAAVSAYAASLPAGERPERLAEVFSAVLDRINAERSQVITGISHYSHRQIEMADRITAREAALADLAAVPEDQRDMDKFEEEQDAIKWDTRVYRDRQQSLSYVCETPVLLEQRAFAIARILQGLI